ncbi:MAG: hypothetical protein JWQ62_2861 [Lacunisphaera sp.]|jgi:hypothetical protein|nr:hypothetical protein [Lacunisphaera sp.]
MAFNLSLTKKSDAQPAAAPLWHPNFRNFERLPDTKVVRTTFFVNTAAIAATLCLLLWLGYREYHIYSLGEQIADAQSQIDKNMRLNKEALRLTTIFSDEEKKLAEAEAFQRTPFSPVEFVTLLGQTLPKGIAIESLEARLAEPGGTATFLLHAVVSGTPDQASGAASSYVDMLRAHPRVGKAFDPITLTNINRDPRGFLTMDISLRIKGEAKEKK